MNENVALLIELAKSLIAERLEKEAIKDGLRRGVRMAPTSAAFVRCEVDPAVVARTRAVVVGDVVTVEVWDGARQSWGEIFRSSVPDVVSTTPAPASAPADVTKLPPPVPGQLILVDGRFQLAK
jgi:hypothetical protein